MKVKFSELTEAFVQTIQTPIVYGGLQGQAGYASPTVAPQSITQPIYPIRQSPQTAKAPQVLSGRVAQSQDASQETSQAAKSAAETGTDTQTASQEVEMPKALPYPQTATQQMPQQSGRFGGQPKPTFVTAPSTPKPPSTNLNGGLKFKIPSRSKTQYEVNKAASDAEFEKFKAFQARKQERAAILAQTRKAEAAGTQAQAAGNVQETTILNNKNILENNVKMQFKPNSLKSLLNDAWDPKNPFGPMFPVVPAGTKPATVAPSGPYTPTPGGVKPKNPKVVTPKKPGISPKVTALVNKPTPQLLGGISAKDATDALKSAGAFLSMPPSVAAAAVSGRLSGLGYDKQTQADYVKHYKKGLGMLGGIAGAVANKIPIVSTVTSILGKAAKLPIVSDYIDAASTEAANLMTGALYDPRAISRPVRLRQEKDS